MSLEVVETPFYALVIALTSLDDENQQLGLDLPDSLDHSGAKMQDK